MGLFILGVIAVFSGVGLMVVGGQTLRRRVRQVDHVLALERDFDPDDVDHSAYYRPRAYR